jgi:GDP-L-fucose synthase
MARLAERGCNAVTCSRSTGCDLRALDETVRFFKQQAPHVVINCASNQGGIAYQKVCPATIYYDNLIMGANTVEAARLAGVTKYVNIIAGCAYPGEPRDGILREDEFEAGPMHPTVENYGSTKRAAVMQAKCYRRQYGFDVISLVLINLYGPGEHFHSDRSHALAALLRKFWEAKQTGAPNVSLWGTGRAVREWLYVEDAAEGILRAAEVYSEADPLNIAVGAGISIAGLAELVQTVVGFEGAIEYDPTKPDGAIHKVADISRMRALLNWTAPTALEEGIRRTLAWFVDNHEEAIHH